MLKIDFKINALLIYYLLNLMHNMKEVIIRGQYFRLRACCVCTQTMWKPCLFHLSIKRKCFIYHLYHGNGVLIKSLQNHKCPGQNEGIIANIHQVVPGLQSRILNPILDFLTQERHQQTEVSSAEGH